MKRSKVRWSQSYGRYEPCSKLLPLHSKVKTMSPFNLVLGKTQLVLYGIASQTILPDQVIATTIIREAWNQGIREFDTAQRYGTSEEVLGKALWELGIS